MKTLRYNIWERKKCWNM